MNPSTNLVSLAKYGVLGFGLLLGFSGEVVRADLPRAPVRTGPRVFGRDIPRFVLLAPIVVNRAQPGIPFAATMMVRMLPGTFIAVTEDAQGI